MREFEAIQRRQEEIYRNRTNRGGLAVVHQQYTTTGQGALDIDDRIDFGLTYLDKPAMSYGHELDPDDLREILGLDPGAALPGFPQCSVYVTEWDQDEKGLYVGAWIAMAVWYPTGVPGDAQLSIVHQVQFAGRAIKMIPVGFDD